MKNFSFFFLLFFLFAGSALRAQNNATATIDKKVIFIGEQVQLTLQATFPKSATTSFYKIDTLPHFEILSTSKIDTVTTASAVQLKQTITLTSWDSGAWLIPAFNLTFSKAYTTSPLKLVVAFSPFDASQPYHEIKDVLDVKKPAHVTWYWYILGAIVLLLLFLLLFPKKKKNEEENLLNANAYKQALAKLDQLKKEANGAAGKPYYTALINIFRTYLQESKGIRSYQNTTGDLSKQLAAINMEDGEFKKLVQALQLSDFVKFAKYEPTATEKEQSLSTIKNSITAIEQIK